MHFALIKIAYQSLKNLFDFSCYTLEFYGFVLMKKIWEYILYKTCYRKNVYLKYFKMC